MIASYLCCLCHHHEYIYSFYSTKIQFAGWATSLSAGESDLSLDYSFFKVVIDLTDAGHG